MPYFSFKVDSPSEAVLLNRHLVIGKGIDVFTITLMLQDLEGFTQQLKDRGIEVLEMHRLDDLQPIPVDPEAPPELPPESILQLLSVSREVSSDDEEGS